MISPTKRNDDLNRALSSETGSLNEPLFSGSQQKSFGIADTRTLQDREPKRSLLDDFFLVDHVTSGMESTARQTTLADVPEVMSSKSCGAKAWIVTRFLLFIWFIIQPFLILEPYEIKRAWYSPLMGILAAALPSGGMPVAGGIVFYPVLTSFSDLTVKEVVEFSAATQLVGVGIFGPLNWYFKNPSVFMWKSIGIAFVVGSVSIVTAHFLLPEVPPEAVDIVFTLFATFVAGYVLHGLVTGALHSQADEVVYNAALIIGLVVAAIFGGMLVLLIGIGIEKTVFTVLTSIQHGDARNAAVSSITIVGMLSVVSVILHKGIPRDPMGYWLVGLPGIVVGSTIGPWMNSVLGKKKIMMVFLMLLIAEIVKSVYKLITD